MKYEDFLADKAQSGAMDGFEPIWMPDFLFDFQRALVEWAIRKGRAAIFADCGLGKTPMQLVWAQNVLQKTGMPVLILTPLAVGAQTVRDGAKFGIDAKQSRDGSVYPITVTNYEQLHRFDPQSFSGVVCDESSILKSFSGETRKQITRFMSKMQYRLLCTATAAPNDYIELGTSSEALGELTYSDMLTRFFRYRDDKGQKQDAHLQDEAEALESEPNYFRKLSFRVAQTIGQWRLKNHAIEPFWRWVASWARACRRPSDLGFDDRNFILPALNERDHIIAPYTPSEGYLFNLPAVGLSEERAERRSTINQRCEFIANLVNHERPAVVWCHMNDEGDLLESMISDGVQIAGKTPEEKKLETYEAFAGGSLRVLIIKPKIGAWGLNWQHCNHVVTFASHSYEQYYQSVRRCWRFGQMRTVDLDVIATEGEARVLANMRSKARKSDLMFDMLTKQMSAATTIKRTNIYTKKTEIPTWL